MRKVFHRSVAGLLVLLVGCTPAAVQSPIHASPQVRIFYQDVYSYAGEGIYLISDVFAKGNDKDFTVAGGKHKGDVAITVINGLPDAILFCTDEPVFECYMSASNEPDTWAACIGGTGPSFRHFILLAGDTLDPHDKRNAHALQVGQSTAFKVSFNLHKPYDDIYTIKTCPRASGKCNKIACKMELAKVV
ncbi:MAG: hypothetical protein ABIF71_04545 [Planctomycetota bacterium]